MNYIFGNKMPEKETFEKMSVMAERVKVGLTMCHEDDHCCDCAFCPYYKLPMDEDDYTTDCSVILGREALEVIRYFTELNEFPDSAPATNEEVKTNESRAQE